MGACGLDFRGNARAGVEATVFMGLDKSAQLFHPYTAYRETI